MPLATLVSNTVANARTRMSGSVSERSRIAKRRGGNRLDDAARTIATSVAFVAHFTGRAGFKGVDGSDGFAGSDGSAGSSDLTNPSAGGRGGDGTNGEDGRDGDP